jgi:L-threonylcarbamoyladenylate synthase
MTHSDLTDAIQAIQHGDVIIYPTDTLYALGADIFNTHAIHTLYHIKQRPTLQPLPIAVDNITTIEHLADLTPIAKKLADHLLPGPLTLVLNKKPTIPPIITSGQETIAIRIPRDPTALTLLHATGPLTATSANLHDEPTPPTVTEIRTHLHTPHLIALDRGPRAQTASTIIDLTTPQPRILRHGTITNTQIQEIIHG